MEKRKVRAQLVERGTSYRQWAIARGYQPRTVTQAVNRYAGKTVLPRGRLTHARHLPLRTRDVLEALCGYAASGATNSELAAAAKTSPPNITRAMAQLIEKGWARKDEATGRFFPNPAFTRLAFRVMADFDRMATRLDDQRRAYTGAPNYTDMRRNLTGENT
jgi:hypothetical protein